MTAPITGVSGDGDNDRGRALCWKEERFRVYRADDFAKMKSR
jgi:hypothetical protein